MDAAIGIGTATPRFEDARLLRGRGRYTDDVQPAGTAYLAVVRSPYARARIAGIEATAARAAPGVLAVLTGAELAADGLGTLATIVQRHRRDGSPMARPPYALLAQGEARFVGDAVAVVVASSRHAAEDGRDLVEVAYEGLPPVTDAEEAVRPGAAVVWPELVPDNVSFVFEQGDRAATERAFRAAHHVATLAFRVSRVSANPMETRNAIGEYDPVEDRYTLTAGTQTPHKVRSELAERGWRLESACRTIP